MALKRCYANGLAKRDRHSGAPRVNTKSLCEFIVHGLRYVFPAKPGEVTRGIATGFAAPVLQDKLMSAGERKQRVAKHVVSAGEGWLTEMNDDQLRDLFALRGEKPLYLIPTAEVSLKNLDLKGFDGGASVARPFSRTKKPRFLRASTSPCASSWS